jgi:mRNA interferase RelE/StbE
MYSVQLSDAAQKNLSKIDKHQAKIIVAWIEKNLEGCDNPRLHGRALTYGLKGLWRYKVGDYRLIADIQDDVIIIEIINVGHRRDIYVRM